MTSFNPVNFVNPQRLSLSDARPFDPGPLTKLESPVKHFDIFYMLKMRNMKIAGPPDLPYAEVTVNGKTVASLSNNGYAGMSNAVGSKIQNLVDQGQGQQRGPMLAQARAEQIARELGGEVVKASTAMTHAEWKAQPEQKLVLDHQAYEKDLARHEKYMAEQSEISRLIREKGYLPGSLLAQDMAQELAQTEGQ